jgi:hypothetical protein
MIQSIAEFSGRVYKRIFPDTFLVRKWDQQKTKDTSPLSGTIADCQVSEDGLFITKQVRKNQAAGDIRDLTMATMIPSFIIQSLATQCLLEYDLIHEAAQQRKFRELWHSDECIDVPRVRKVTSEFITMDYIQWPRFSDCPPHVARTSIPLIMKFFVYSICRVGLVHGDISRFNVLVKPDDGTQICVIDYGLTSHMPKLKPPKTHPGITIDDAWRLEGFKFSMEWWSAHTWMNVSGDSNTDGVFARSMLSLTRMACECEYVVGSAIGLYLDDLHKWVTNNMEVQ